MQLKIPDVISPRKIAEPSIRPIAPSNQPFSNMMRIDFAVPEE